MESRAGQRRGWIEQRRPAPYIEQSGPPARPPDWGLACRETPAAAPLYARYLRRGLKLSPELM